MRFHDPKINTLRSRSNSNRKKTRVLFFSRSLSVSIEISWFAVFVSPPLCINEANQGSFDPWWSPITSYNWIVFVQPLPWGTRTTKTILPSLPVFLHQVTARERKSGFTTCFAEKPEKKTWVKMKHHVKPLLGCTTIPRHFGGGQLLQSQQVLSHLIFRFQPLVFGRGSYSFTSSMFVLSINKQQTSPPNSRPV